MDALKDMGYFHAMYDHPKTAYHPFLILAFYLECLPQEWLREIPRSTRYDWRQKEQAHLYGYEWYRQHQSLFNTLQQVASHRRLLEVNRALLRIIALRNFLQTHSHRIKDNIFRISAVILINVCKVTRVLGSRLALKYIGRSYSWLLQMRRRICAVSVLQLCRISHPAQLLAREVTRIKQYCTDSRYLRWPLASVYYQMRRDGIAGFSLHTFYKYASFLQLKRMLQVKRRKNHAAGIRSGAPLQILHADTTVFRTADNRKNYIYLVQDNYSRMILAYRLADACKASFVFENLQQVHRQYLLPSELSHCLVLTDDGSENKGPVIQWGQQVSSPTIELLTAQLDIQFSNSMIEAANKQLKYRFLYHQYIPDAAALANYLPKAVEEYNNRPHHALDGLTPSEVLSGRVVDQPSIAQLIKRAKEARMTENKLARCCTTF